MFYPTSRLFEEASTGTGETGSGGETHVFDPVAFRAELRTEIMGEFNKTLNGFSKTFKADIVKLVTPPKPPDTPPPADPPPGDTKIDPAVNAEMQKLARQVATLTQQNAERETAFQREQASRLETERQAAITGEISKIPWKDDASRALFQKGIQGDIKRDEDGNLIADTATGPITFSDYIKGQAELLPSLLQAKGTGGTGASNAGKRINGFNANDMANLEPVAYNKLTPEQRQAVDQTVLAALPQNQ